MSEQPYRIVRTQPWTYIDRGGQPVNGVRVYVDLPEFDEQHTLEVPRLDPEVIDREARDLLNRRRALADLGG